MKRTILFLLLVLMSGLLVAQTGGGAFNGRIKEGDNYYKEALALQKKADALRSSGKYKEAKTKYNEALKKYDDAKNFYDASLAVVGITDSETATANKKLADVRKQKKSINASIAAMSQPTKLEVSETNLAFSSETSVVRNVIVKGDNWKYNSEELPWWIDCNRNDTGFSVSCSNNTSIESRSFTIVVTADGNQSAEVHVRQSAAEEYLSVSPSNLTFDEDGGTKEVKVNTNAPNFSVHCSSTWVKINKKGSSFNVKCESNPDRESRNTQIVVKTNSEMTDYLSVLQAKKSLHLPFDAVSLRVGGSFEASLDFYLDYDKYIEASIGMWNILEYGASAYGASAAFIKERELGDSDFMLYYGGGVGLGVVYSTFGGKLGGVVGVEYALPISSVDMAVTLDYRPDIGISFYGYYSNFINFNVGAKYYF